MPGCCFCLTHKAKKKKARAAPGIVSQGNHGPAPWPPGGEQHAAGDLRLKPGTIQQQVQLRVGHREPHSGLPGWVGVVASCHLPGDPFPGSRVPFCQGPTEDASGRVAEGCRAGDPGGLEPTRGTHARQLRRVCRYPHPGVSRGTSRQGGSSNTQSPREAEKKNRHVHFPPSWVCESRGMGVC